MLFPTRVGIGHASRIPDVIRIESDVIHAFGNKAAAIGIDQPEHSVMLADAKEAASAEAVIDDSTPFGSLQSDTPAAR